MNRVSRVFYPFDTQVVSPGNIFAATGQGHGHVETRTHSIISADLLEQKSEWKGLEFLGKVVNETHRDGQFTQETRFFLFTFGEIARFAEVVRDTR